MINKKKICLACETRVKPKKEVFIESKQGILKGKMIINVYKSHSLICPNCKNTLYSSYKKLKGNIKELSKGV